MTLSSCYVQLNHTLPPPAYNITVHSPNHTLNFQHIYALNSTDKQTQIMSSVITKSANLPKLHENNEKCNLFITFSSVNGARGGVVTSIRGGIPSVRRDVRSGVPSALQGYGNSASLLRSSRQEGGRWRCDGDKECWGRSLLPPEERFDSTEAWVDAFMYTFKRDTIFNVAKIGGIILLYYLAPDVLTWYNDSFG